MESGEHSAQELSAKANGTKRPEMNAELQSLKAQDKRKLKSVADMSLFDVWPDG